MPRDNAAPHSALQQLASLREGLAGEPSAIRRLAANVVREVASAQFGLWYRFGLIDEEPYPVEWVIHGAPETVMARQSLERIPWPSGDPRIPDRAWCGRFRTLRSIVPLDAFGQTRLYERCYAPVGVHDQARMMLYHRGRHVAWIGALRGRGEKPFSASDLRRLRSLAGPLTDALVHADATARAATPEEGADLVIDTNGRIELHSEAARPIVDHSEKTAMLAQWVRAAEAGASVPRVIAGLEVRWCRLYGSGRSRYLLHLEPVQPVRLRRDFELSRTQRTVADYAAAGARVAEIAEALAIAPTTVRTHLRAVYETLGIGSRAELVRALAEPPDDDVREREETAP